MKKTPKARRAKDPSKGLVVLQGVMLKDFSKAHQLLNPILLLQGCYPVRNTAFSGVMAVARMMNVAPVAQAGQVQNEQGSSQPVVVADE